VNFFGGRHLNEALLLQTTNQPLQLQDFLFCLPDRFLHGASSFGRMSGTNRGVQRGTGRWAIAHPVVGRGQLPPRLKAVVKRFCGQARLIFPALFARLKASVGTHRAFYHLSLAYWLYCLIRNFFNRTVDHGGTSYLLINRGVYFLF